MLQFITFLYFFVIQYLIETTTINYCNSDVCDGGKKHVLCQFQSEDPARHCIDYEELIKTEKEKRSILDKLNSRRNKVAAGDIRSMPAAGNMYKLEWNEELEISAQRWANQCVKHSVPDIKDDCRDIGKVYVGQNIATIAGEAPGLTPVGLVDVWYMELLNMNASILTKYQPSSVARFPHYDYFTQLIWAETSQVGCGGVKFKEKNQENNSSKNRTIYRLVCNFAPGGNILNQPVYMQNFPCSKCPTESCDTVYTALCSSIEATDKITSKSTKMFDISKIDKIPSISSIEQNEVATTDEMSQTRNTLDEVATNLKSMQTTNDDENYTFDYFSDLHEFTRETLTTTDKGVSSCKDVLVVDEFVELLKKKLSSDPMFKDILLTTKIPPVNAITDGILNDVSVAALVSRLYSKKLPARTSKTTESDYLNSTLLVDLVEAVIFRSGDKVQTAKEILSYTQPLQVNPIKIQAELAEVKPNLDFTGHYFFPEDDGDINDEDQVTTETTESYYDVSIIPVSDIVQEIEDLRKAKRTKDFLEEIIESDSVTERLSNSLRKKREVKSYIKDINKRMKRGYDYLDYSNDKSQCNSDNTYLIKYSDLLRKLALDLEILKLNDRFHCAGSSSVKCFANFFSTFATLLFIFIFK